MEKIMRVGIIGCGNIAQVHAWSLCRIQGMKLVAFADCKLQRAEAMNEKYADGKANCYADYREMLDEVALDAVHICTPHFLHVPMAMDCLEKEVNVFMEKPPAISLEEFEALQQIASRSKGKIGFCFQNRYNATTRELDQIVASGELGSVIGARGFVTWRRDEGYYADDWHGQLHKEGGGALINQSIHTLDLMLRYLGEPENVKASMRNHHLQAVIQVEDTLESWMEFSDGKRACFYVSTGYATDAPVILELAFEKGRVTMIDQLLQIHRDGETKIIPCEETNDGIGKSYWGRGHMTCIKDYYSCLASGKEYCNNLDGVANTLITTMRIYEAARGKNPAVQL